MDLTDFDIIWDSLKGTLNWDWTCQLIINNKSVVESAAQQAKKSD
jgi:hypothetical protein